MLMRLQVIHQLTDDPFTFDRRLEVEVLVCLERLYLPKAAGTLNLLVDAFVKSSVDAVSLTLSPEAGTSHNK